MKVTEFYATAICEASNQKVKLSRLRKYHDLLDQFFADRLREYVAEHAPEAIKKAQEGAPEPDAAENK